MIDLRKIRIAPNSIRTRLTLAFLLLAVVPLLIVGLVLINKSYSVQTQGAISLQREMATRLSSRIQSLIRNLEKNFQMLIRIKDLERMEPGQQKLLLSIFHSRQSALDDLILLDIRGRVLSYNSRLKLKNDLPVMMKKLFESFRVPVSQGKTYFGPVYFHTQSYEPLMIMAVPIIALDTGKPKVVLVAVVRLKEIWDLVAKIRPGQKGASYIVDAGGRVVAHSNPSVVLRGTRFKPPPNDGVYQGISGEESVLVSKVISFGSQHFHIIVEGPVSEALAPAINTLRIMLAIVIAAFLAAGVFGFVTVRRLVRPVRDIAETAREISEGDLSRRVIVTSQDEFGILANAFNKMTSQLESFINELEKRVAERTTELEESNKELESFAYSVSHDLRAPLRHIDGFLGLLKKKLGTSLDNEGRRYIEQASTSALKMGQLIDDLLSFSRMGRQALSFDKLDLNKIVHKVIEELKPDIADRNVNWRLSDLLPVRGDGPMIQVVLFNIISNALKFTEHREEAVIEIGCRRSESESIFYVRDNGVGFIQDYSERLFGVFQRLHRSDEFEGTGVGLAIAQRVIHRHGGIIWAEGEPGKGAVFYFSLPSGNPSSGERPGMDANPET